MPRQVCRYNRIDDALCSQIICTILSEDLSYTDTNEHYEYPHETVRSVAKALEKKWVN